jgi:acetyl-CoA decarbonylase/synthase complex subunit gamma
LTGDGTKIEVGNETVMFRHEKTFYHRPGVFIRVKDSQDPKSIQADVAKASAYGVDYVGIKLVVDGFAVESVSGDRAKFAAAVGAVAAVSKNPLILMATDPAVLAEGAKVVAGTKPLLYAADETNWQQMVEVAKSTKAPLTVKADSIEKLAGLTENIRKAGIEDLVLDPVARGCGASLTTLTQIRRLALKKNFHPLGFPVVVFPGEAEGVDETVMAVQQIAKYAGFVVLDSFDPAVLYPLLVLRQNLYTDPQKPIQVEPGLYEINAPTPDAPVMVTTNFSITYFAVNNEVEGAGWPAWLVVTDADGMSVLTAWAAGKLDSDRIAKAVKACAVEGKINHKRLIIPGQVAVLSGELEESLAGWEIMVGPKEAVDIPAYLKAVWKR